MARVTDINGLTVPELGDSPPDIETAFAMADQIDTRINPVFATPTLRDIAIPTPTAGMEAWCTSTGEKYLYNGSKWVSAKPRFFNKLNHEGRYSDNALSTDLDLNFSMEVDSFYVARWSLYMQGSDINAGMQIHFVVPAAADILVGLVGPSGVVGNSADTTVTVQHEQNPALLYIGTPYGRNHIIIEARVINRGTAGNCNFQWSQINSMPINVAINSGSYLEVWKTD